MATPTDPPPPRPWVRRLRQLLFGAAALLVLLAVLGWFLPAIVAGTALRHAVLARVLPKLDGTVTVGGMGLGWFRPVELRDVHLLDSAGREVLVAPTITTAKSLAGLVRGAGEVGEVTLDGPMVTVVCGNKTTNVEQVLAPLLGGGGGSGSPAGERAGVTVRVRRGTLVFRDDNGPPGAPLTPVEVIAVVPRPRTEPVKVDVVAAAPTGGKLDLGLVFAANTGVTLNATAFPTDSLGPVVRRFAPGTRLAGALSADLKLGFGAETTVAGRARVDDLDLAGPWLGPDHLHLAQADLPCELASKNGVLTVATARLTCDAGAVSAVGTFDPKDTTNDLVSRPGMQVAADVDLAHLARLLPRLLKLRDGVAVTEGRLAARLASAAGTKGTGWSGEVGTTALKATRDGKAVTWDQPIRAAFAGHFRPDGLPEFDKLECSSDFVGLAARGTIDEFVLKANLNLDHLSAHLKEFVDLGPAALAGTGSLEVRMTSRAGGGGTLLAAAKLLNFRLAEDADRGMTEPDLELALKADGKRVPRGPLSLDTGTLKITAAGGDALTVTLLEPIPDLRTAHAGRVAATLAGDLGRWRDRFGSLAAIPPEWVVGGAGTIGGEVALSPAAVTCPKLAAALKGLRFRGTGLVLDEPTFDLETGVAADRASGAVEFTDLRLTSNTVGAAGKRLRIDRDAGGYRAAGALKLDADLARVQHAAGASKDPAGADSVRGRARGTVQFDAAAGGAVTFDADMVVKNLAVGPLAKPTWAEPELALVGVGKWDPLADGLTLSKLKAARDGLGVEAAGTIAKLSTPAPAADIQGKLAYDLSKLEPQLQGLLGQEAHAAGKSAGRPFQLRGSLGNGGRDLAVAVEPDGKPAGGPEVVPLTGSASAGWDMLRAFGFTVGQTDLAATLDHGVATVSPVEAQFGGGTIKLAPTVKLNPGAYDLSLPAGPVVTKAKLTPAVCANALGYALPALANVAQADGTISVELGDNRVPLADPKKALVNGYLTVHNATVSPGPLATQIMGLFQAKPASLTLASEQRVPFRVENGRVYHDDFTIMIGGTAVKSSGSVGLDGTTDLYLDMPVPPKLLGLFHNPEVQKAFEKRTIRLPVGGTLGQPRLDAAGFQQAVAKLTREAGQDAVRGAGRDWLGGLLKKETGKFLPAGLSPPPAATAPAGP